MKRIRNSKHQATLNLPTIQLEGSLFLPDQLEKAAQGRAQGQAQGTQVGPARAHVTLGTSPDRRTYSEIE